MKKFKVLFVGESVDDNIFVIKNIASELQKIIIKENLQFEFSYITSGKGKFQIKGIKNIKIGSIFSSFIFFPFLFLGAFIYLFIDTPNLIFTKGGYISLPLVLSADILRIPIFLHETNSSLSRINKFISKKCLIIFTSFNNTKGLDKKKELRLGFPIIEESDKYSITTAKKNIEDFLKRKINRPVLFFDSRSSNNEKINDFILNILDDLIKNFFVFHQTTKKLYIQVKKESDIVLDKEGKNFYYLFFSEDKDKNNIANNVQIICDLIISEFGEGLIFKISALHKPSILIIFPNKQELKKSKEEKEKIENAYSYAKTGASVIIEEPNLKKYLFLDKLNNLFGEGKKEKLIKMSERAKEFSTPEAGKLIATYLLEYWKFILK